MGKCVDPFLFSATFKSYLNGFVSNLVHLDLSEIPDEETIPLHTKRESGRPSRDRNPSNMYMQTPFHHTHSEDAGKGFIDFKMDELSDRGREALSKVIQDLRIDESELDENDSKMIKDLYGVLSMHPNFKNMSPDDVLDMLQLKKEDRKQVDDALQSILSKAEKDLSQVDLTEIFPGIQDSVTSLVSALQNAVKADPSLQTELDEWMKSARSKVGEDLKGMESLSDEEFSTIALPPERLRNAMIPFMKPPSRLEDVNLDVGMDPNKLFVVPKR